VTFFIQWLRTDAIRTAYSRRHEYVTTEHLVCALLYEKTAARIFQGCGADVEELKSELEAYLSSEVPELPEEEEQADTRDSRSPKHYSPTRGDTSHGEGYCV